MDKNFLLLLQKIKRKAIKKEAVKLYLSHFFLYQMEKEIKIAPCKIDFLISQRQLFTKAIHIFAINIMIKEPPPNFIF